MMRRRPSRPMYGASEGHEVGAQQTARRGARRPYGRRGPVPAGAAAAGSEAGASRRPHAGQGRLSFLRVGRPSPPSAGAAGGGGADGAGRAPGAGLARALSAADRLGGLAVSRARELALCRDEPGPCEPLQSHATRLGARGASERSGAGGAAARLGAENDAGGDDPRGLGDLRDPRAARWSCRCGTAPCGRLPVDLGGGGSGHLQPSWRAARCLLAGLREALSRRPVWRPD